MEKSKNVLVIGGGNMGSALVKGLSAQATSASITVVDIHPDKLKHLQSLKGVATQSTMPTQLKDFHSVILCVKPTDLAAITKQLVKNGLSTKGLIVSILAGITLADLAASFGEGQPIVRTMPNIAATVGMAATVACSNSFCSEDQKAEVDSIFSKIGACFWAPERTLDAVTGLSGSGPAYAYMIIESLTDGGVKMGIPRHLAAPLAVQTILGAASLVKQSGLHPAILKDQVTTPGGTTIHAIHELEAHGLRAMLISAVATATKKSQELRMIKAETDSNPLKHS